MRFYLCEIHVFPIEILSFTRFRRRIYSFLNYPDLFSRLSQRRYERRSASMVQLSERSRSFFGYEDVSELGRNPLRLSRRISESSRFSQLSSRKRNPSHQTLFDFFRLRARMRGISDYPADHGPQIHPLCDDRRFNVISDRNSELRSLGTMRSTLYLRNLIFDLFPDEKPTEYRDDRARNRLILQTSGNFLSSRSPLSLDK